jgi:RNA polymerase sigma-70 factor (ECF subfamily)
MAAYVAGDESAFYELFERYSARLLRLLRRQVASPEDAADLLQQTFLQLHRSRNDFRAGAQVRPWLYTIALNLKREYFRRRGRRPEAKLFLDGYQDPHVGPREVEKLEAARTLYAALERLPREQREVIEMHWLDGLGFSEIAGLLGANVNTVKVRAHRGYQTLRSWLGDSESGGQTEGGQSNQAPPGGIRERGGGGR